MPDASLIETLTAEKPTHTPGHWYVKQRNGQKRPTICEHTYGGKAIAKAEAGK